MIEWRMGVSLMALVGWSAGGVARAETPPRVRVIRDVEYVRRDDQPLRADVYLPVQSGPHPCVLMIHGGAWLAGVKEHTAWHSRRLAEQGLASVAIDYRLAPLHPFPAQLEDCRAALAWLATVARQYELDTRRVAVCGYSAGGHLACLLATTTSQEAAVHGTTQASTRLAAVVAGGAPCEFRSEPEGSRRLAFWLGGSRAEEPQAYADASPVKFVTAQCPPIFLYHGEVDRLVPLGQPKVLLDQLRAAGVPAELHVVRQVGHLGAFWDQATFQNAIDFLQSQLTKTADSVETAR